MLKRDELTDPNSCLNKAQDDEPVFVLLGRDVAASYAILEWCSRRVQEGMNRWEDPQIREALLMREQMRLYYESRKNE